MPRKISAPEPTNRLIHLVKQFSAWRRGTGVIIFILTLALITRTVNLSSFPYFPPDWPWNGVNGLYTDEYTTLFSVAVYFPFFQTSLMLLAINVLGYSTFSLRLVSALFSSVTSVLVYLSSFELFRKRLPALLSSLFFIFMTPALIYGRMAFVENGAATFFVATFLFSIKYLKTSESRWLISAVISAGLSFLCKQTGIVAMIYLVLVVAAYKPDAMKQLLKILTIGGFLIAGYVIQVMIANPAFFADMLRYYVYGGIRSVDWFNIFLTTPMPTGHSLMWHDFPEMLSYFWLIRVDFWYTLAYFVIVYLLVKEKASVHKVILAVAPYILLLIVIGHANVYYVTLVQPFMAIPAGQGLLKLQRMPAVFAFAFSLLLCFPAITYINYYVSNFLILNVTIDAGAVLNAILATLMIILLLAKFCYDWIKRNRPSIINIFFLIYYTGWLVVGNYVLSVFYTGVLWTILQFTIVIPLVIMGVVRLSYGTIGEDRAVNINRLFILFYVGCLILGSYVLPVFYPGYFAQSSVPV